MRAIPRMRKSTRRLLLRSSAALGALALVGWGTAALMRSRDDGTAAATPVGPPAATPAASTTAPSSASATAPAAAVPRVLRVSASGAAILVDGLQVGQGRFESANLTPGRHVVVARLAPMAGCASTVDSAVISLADTGLREVRLAPRSCGALALAIRPVNATWTLTAPGRAPLTGKAALPRSLLLPVGRWHLHVEAPACGQFEGDYDIEHGQTKAASPKLLCGEG
jgi:hypothetical protein